MAEPRCIHYFSPYFLWNFAKNVQGLEDDELAYYFFAM
jgi:hypothetical protein